MRLVISTPTTIAVDIGDVRYVRAEDSSGSFGIQPGHADFLTALTITVVIWRDATGEHYTAVRGGLLRVRDGNSVEIATREAAVGENLTELRKTVLADLARNSDTEKAARVGALGLQQAAIQQIYRYLRPGEPRRDPLVDKA